jgi:hypothetical protein
MWAESWVKEGVEAGLKSEYEGDKTIALSCLVELSGCKENQGSMWGESWVKSGIEAGLKLPSQFHKTMALNCLVSLATKFKKKMSRDGTLLESLRRILVNSDSKPDLVKSALLLKHKLVGWSFRSPVSHLIFEINKLEKTSLAHPEDETTLLLGGTTDESSSV